MSTGKQHTAYAAYALMYFPWVMLCTATMLSLFVPFSYWARNAEHFGEHDMGWALFFSFSFPIALYSSLGISLLSLAAAAVYRIKKSQGSNILLFAFLAGLMPIAFILWLDS